MRARLLLGFAALGMTTSVWAADPAGRPVFQKWCAPCHAPGPNHPGTAALDVLYGKAIPGALEQRTDLSGAAVRRAVRQGAFSMPFFRKTEVSDADLDALVAYLAKAGK
jgi:mono/diheme cytochrome c family protein